MWCSFAVEFKRVIRRLVSVKACVIVMHYPIEGDDEEKERILCIFQRVDSGCILFAIRDLDTKEMGVGDMVKR